MCPLPPIPRPRSIHGWMHDGAQLTEIRQWKPDSWRAGRNPRAAFRGFAPAQSTKGPQKRAKPTGGHQGSSKSSFDSTYDLKTTSFPQISILPCWETGSHPSVLFLPSLGSSPAVPDVFKQDQAVLWGNFSCSPTPHHHRDGTGRAVAATHSHPDELGARGGDLESRG